MRGVLNSKLKPLARSEGLVVEEVGDELLVADPLSNRAHSLNAFAARVWQACDGETTAEELVTKLDSDRDSVAHALAELSDCELLERTGPPIVGNGGMTRRDLGVRAAKVGAAAAIISVALPVAEAAATPTPAKCLLYTDSDCDNCTNICGCCCCGQAGGGATEPSCKTCYTISGCPTHSLHRGRQGRPLLREGAARYVRERRYAVHLQGRREDRVPQRLRSLLRAQAVHAGAAAVHLGFSEV